MAKATKPKQPKPLQADTAAVEAKLATIIAGLEKEHGDGIISVLSGPNKIIKQPYQVPSGSISLDLALGTMYRHKDGRWETGYGPGRILECFGPEGSGKTTLMLLFIASAQRKGGRCAFIDAEHNLDPNYAAKLGVDLSKLYICQPANGEQALNIAETLLKSGLFSAIVIDSVAALIPKSELENDVGDSSMGVQARMMSQALRKISVQLGQGVSTNVFFTNQIREKIGVMFGNPETTPGGRALRFFASYRIDVRRGEQFFQGEGDAKIPVGHELKLNVIKNKLAAPFRRAKCPLYYGVGIDNSTELLDLGEEWGVVEKVGNFYKYEGKVLGNGRPNSVMQLRSDPGSCYRIYNELLTKFLDAQGYTPELELIPGRDAAPSAGGATFKWLPNMMTQEEIAAAAAETDGQDAEVEPVL